MKDSKFRSKVLSLIELIITFKWRVSIFLLILPILILIAFFILLDMRQSNLFFLIVFLLNYYIAVFILILIFAKSINVRKKARSPFYFIKSLHFSHNKDHWDKYKQPLKHLTGAEIGVYKGENAKDVVPALVLLLQGQRTDVFVNATWALVKIGTPEALKGEEDR